MHEGVSGSVTITLILVNSSYKESQNLMMIPIYG